MTSTPERRTPDRDAAGRPAEPAAAASGEPGAGAGGEPSSAPGEGARDDRREDRRDDRPDVRGHDRGAVDLDAETRAGLDADLDAGLDAELRADLDAGFDAGFAAAGADSDGGAPPRNPPRWVRWTVVPLLVLVPMGYVVISAAQSRGAGISEQQQAASRKLAQVYPTLLQQRIYQVHVPVGSRYTRYLETNSWDTSVFYAEFLTTSGGLDTFLAQVGTSRAALRAGEVPMTPAQCKAAGWNFAIPRTWAGVSLHQFGDKPDHEITVDLTYPDTPRVYVVSTVNFQHGFGGGS